MPYGPTRHRPVLALTGACQKDWILVTDKYLLRKSLQRLTYLCCIHIVYIYIKKAIPILDSNSKLPGTEFLVRNFMSFLTNNVTASLTP